jgi:hypothetical protein
MIKIKKQKRAIVEQNHTLVPWTMFKTPSGRPASIANSASIIEAPVTTRKTKLLLQIKVRWLIILCRIWMELELWLVNIYAGTALVPNCFTEFSRTFKTMFLCITKKIKRKKPIIRQDNFEIIEQFPLTVQSWQLASTGKNTTYDKST